VFIGQQFAFIILNIQVKFFKFFDVEEKDVSFRSVYRKDISYTEFGLVSFYGGIQQSKVLVTVSG
jgi:hypothetical protein